MSGLITPPAPLPAFVPSVAERSGTPVPSILEVGSKLAPAYYLDDFEAVIEGVRARYGNRLTPDEQLYCSKLDALSRPAKQLYARLVNRRGPYFRVAKIAYPEIADIEAAVGELGTNALLKNCLGRNVPAGVLSCFTHPELKQALRPHKRASPGRKSELLATLGDWEGYGAWIAEFLQSNTVVRITESDPWAFLRFLFFGELRDNLSDFVTRALGRVVTEAIEPATLQALFTCRQQMDDAFRMAQLYANFRSIRDTHTACEILIWWQAQAIERKQLSAGQDWFDRLIDRLGRTLEREGEPAGALELYATCPVAPARERRARLLIKSGDIDAAREVLREMLAGPCHAEEAYAARQILAKLEKPTRRSEARHYELLSKTLVLEYSAGKVEAAVLEHYRDQGWQGIHSENWLWNACFGLLLWDIIYDSKSGAFHSPLQFAPSDLYDRLFYERRKPAIEARLATLKTAYNAFEIMRKNFENKNGVSNPFVSWHEDLLDALEVMLRLVPHEGLIAALRHLALNVKKHSSGLPDLFIWNGSEYRFIEIKAENDHLSGHQYEWLRVMAEAGINVSLEKVERPAHVLPDQELQAANV
jgi:hypothetical protein